MADPMPTTLTIKNGIPGKDSVLVYLTLGAQSNNAKISDFPYFTPVDGNPYMGSYSLKDSYTFAGRYMSGNICFGAQPSCPNEQAPNGTSIFEFTLNPSGDPPHESIDISCVNGVNSLISVDVTGDGGTFLANGQVVSFPIYNQGMGYGDNYGLTGVYPIGCPSCTYANNPPPCPSLTSQQPQTDPICSLGRTQRGGNISVTVTSYYTPPSP
ncbi:MAG TPA: hypothetical protein VGM86_09300 [Thermoanaerobaculia bacterium]|jgi:hypothetical protein